MIDLDQNATTPLDPAVLERMSPYLLRGGNAESRHGMGREMRRGVDQALQTVASILHCREDEILFTSGGTEANNLALASHFAQGDLVDRRKVIASAIEHPAVLEPLAAVEADKAAAAGTGAGAGTGRQVERIMPVGSGIVPAERFAAAIDASTSLCTLMLANNETGAIQPVRAVAELAAERGIAVHTDAVQAVGRIPVAFESLGVATLAASAHKFHGPPGVGLLLVRRGVRINPLLRGGGQQRGLRPGTVPVALVVGLAAALERFHLEAETRIDRWRGLRDRLEQRLIAELGVSGVVRNGPADDADRLPQTLNLAFPGLAGDLLFLALDVAGLAVSLGSACSSGAGKPSPTLAAMGLAEDRLRSSVRFSLGAATTQAEVDHAAEIVISNVRRLTLETDRSNAQRSAVGLG